MSTRNRDLVRIGYRLGGTVFALACEITVMSVLVEVFDAPEAIALPIMIASFVLAVLLALRVTSRLPLPAPDQAPRTTPSSGHDVDTAARSGWIR